MSLLRHSGEEGRAGAYHYEYMKLMDCRH